MSYTATIYHNPHCSKSRETLSLLKDKGIEPDVVFYLENPPDGQTIKHLLKLLGFTSARDLMRQKESLYSELNLADPTLSEEVLIATLVANPTLIERPVVVFGYKARIGRPPEQVLEIF